MSDALSAIPADWEDAETVRRSARRNGRPLTDKQLHTAQQRGAIPRPRQVLLGRKGSRVFYEPGTSNQLRRYCALLDDGATVEEAIWRLWWDGYPIAEQVIRERLAAELEQARRMVAWQAALTSASAEERDHAEEQLLDLSLKRYRARPAALLLGRGASAFPEVYRVVASLVSGDFVRLSERSARVLATALGATVSASVDPTDVAGPMVDNGMMRQVSTVFVQMRDTPLADVGWERLQEARNECRLLLAVFPAFLASDVATVSPQAAELLRSFMSDEAASLQPLLMLAWLFARNTPGVRDWFGSFSAALDTARKSALSLSLSASI
jgi:hypothetical protein